MGKDFVEFRGHGFWVKDWAMEVWLCFLIPKLRNHYNLHPDAFRDLRDTWYFAATAGCQGFVGGAAALDRVLCNEHIIEVAVKASEKTLEAVQALGPKLDYRYLNMLGTGTSSFTGDMDSWMIVQVGDHFLRLLRGELAWELRTSPLLPTETPEPRKRESPGA
jgi:hypothetical protein